MRLKPNRLIVTGGIGSGKSAVRAYLGELGYHEIDSDRIGHGVLRSDGAAFGAVALRWPEVIVDGEIDRTALAGVVFSDKTQLRELEAITHPLIFDRIGDQVQRIDGPVVVELPVATDAFSGWTRVVVDSPDEMRLERAVARGATRSDVQSRMESQLSRAQWLALADIVIPNVSDLSDLRSSVREIVQYLSRSVTT